MAIGGEIGGLQTTNTVEILTPPCRAANARLDLFDIDSNGNIGIEEFLEIIPIYLQAHKLPFGTAFFFGNETLSANEVLLI